MFDDGKIERRDEARAIRSSLAVNEDRFSGGPQKREQFLGALRTQFLAGGKTKVDVIDVKSSRFRDLGFVPRAALAVAAKVDDSLDAIFRGIVVKLLRCDLPGPIQFTHHNRVEISAKSQREQITPTENKGA